MEAVEVEGKQSKKRSRDCREPLISLHSTGLIGVLVCPTQSSSEQLVTCLPGQRGSLPRRYQ